MISPHAFKAFKPFIIDAREKQHNRSILSLNGNHRMFLFIFFVYMISFGIFELHFFVYLHKCYADAAIPPCDVTVRFLHAGIHKLLVST